MIHDSSNLLVHLRPAPVVARVATATAEFREGDAWLAREVAVGAHLAETGAPVVPLSGELPPGPHEHDGFVLTFWQHVTLAPAPPDPLAAGEALREVHEALRSYRGRLPRLAAMGEAERMAPALRQRGLVSGDDAELIARAGRATLDAVEALDLPLQPVHGDAHLGNALATRDGVLWCDLEDTFLGPVAWDHACLVMTGREFGRDPEPGERALRASGGADLPDALVKARAVQIVAWTAGIAADREHVESRLRWARERYGG